MRGYSVQTFVLEAGKSWKPTAAGPIEVPDTKAHEIKQMFRELGLVIEVPEIKHVTVEPGGLLRVEVWKAMG